MSRDWHVHCVDCKSTHRFYYANNASELMLVLCRNAEAIAALDDLMRATPDVELRAGHSYGAVDTAWFRQHLGHQLLPIDEYGALLNQCWKYAHCAACKHPERCVLQLDHDGECAPKEPR